MQLNKSITFYRNILKKTFFNYWFTTVAKQLYQKILFLNKFYQFSLKKKFFAFLKNHAKIQQQYKKERFYLIVYQFDILFF